MAKGRKELKRAISKRKETDRKEIRHEGMDLEYRIDAL